MGDPVRRHFWNAIVCGGGGVWIEDGVSARYDVQGATPARYGARGVN